MVPVFVPIDPVDHSKSVERRKGEIAQQNLIWLLASASASR
jgi:hypothetical protein